MEVAKLSHEKLFQQGKITRQQYENAKYLKESGQPNMYREYEKSLERTVKAREKAQKSIPKNEPVQLHIVRAEATR